MPCWGLVWLPRFAVETIVNVKRIFSYVLHFIVVSLYRRRLQQGLQSGQLLHHLGTVPFTFVGSWLFCAVNWKVVPYFFVSPPPLLCCIARKERLPGFDFGLSPPSPDETEGKRAWDLHHQTIFSVLSWLAIVQGNTVVWTAVTCFGARGVGKEAEEEQQAASPRSPMGSRRREMGRRRKIIANTGAKRESVMTQGKTVFGCTQEASF